MRKKKITPNTLASGKNPKQAISINILAVANPKILPNYTAIMTKTFYVIYAVT